ARRDPGRRPEHDRLQGRREGRSEARPRRGHGPPGTPPPRHRCPPLPPRPTHGARLHQVRIGTPVRADLIHRGRRTIVMGKDLGFDLEGWKSFGRPSIAIESSPTEPESIEFRLFLRWEKLRLLYNAILWAEMAL